MADLKDRHFESEFIFNTSRSSGPGGQNVNKVSSKVELRFNVPSSLLLNENEKEIIMTKLANKINLDGFLILVSQVERSQLQNKERVVEKFYITIEKTLKPVKTRRASKPSRAAREKRLTDKKFVGEKKALRSLNIDES